ncbi:hypothetical protein pipiens_017162 [Culex pipiens pipiens]|uniref:Uncharacterized protein n=1 Tax=Culex pipiens pipiens TaxID=38569 RepID=A0ABD1CHV7_CULPP
MISDALGDLEKCVDNAGTQLETLHKALESHKSILEVNDFEKNIEDNDMDGLETGSVLELLDSLVYTEESLASTDKNKMLYITHHLEVKRRRYLLVQSGRGVETFSQGNNGCRRENLRLRRFFTRAPRASFTRLRCGTCRKVARTKHPQGGSEPGRPPVGTGEGECGGVFD